MQQQHANSVKEMISVAVGQNSIRCLGLPDRKPAVLRPAGGVREEAEGEILRVAVRREWQFNRARFISGKIIGGYVDGRILSPVPLELYERGVWDPHEEWTWLMDEMPPGGMPDWMRSVLDEGPRPKYEMEQVIPGYDYEDPDDPITIAASYGRTGDYRQAFDLLHKCLEGDLRCIDAYVHLGLYHLGKAEFDWDVRRAIKCYQAGVAVGEQALPPGFDGVLAWGWIDNRPFLRALHGLGICQWWASLRWHRRRSGGCGGLTLMTL